MGASVVCEVVGVDVVVGDVVVVRVVVVVGVVVAVVVGVERLQSLKVPSSTASTITFNKFAVLRQSSLSAASQLVDSHLRDADTPPGRVANPVCKVLTQQASSRSGG